MCCDVCPHYTRCDEDGQVGDDCCTTCPEYASCRDDDENGAQSDGESEDFGEDA